MGICGTQIALNASDIMLLDDNFSSIVQAIKWGRNVLEVIRRFVQFQLICNLSAILITFIGSCTLADHKSPITPVQLLWVNLIMDSLGALALATDEPEDDILDRKPTARTDALITKKMKEYIIAGAVYQVTLVLFVLYSGYGLVNVSSSNSKLIGTLAFNTFVLLQVTNEVMARQLHHELNFTKNIFRNKLFLSILIVIGFIQFIMIQWGGSFVETVVLSPLEWALCIIIAAAYIPYCLGTRIIFRLNEYFYDRRQPMPTALSRAKSVNSTKSATSNRALDVGTPKTKLPPLPGQSQKNVSTASLSSKSAKIIVTGTITADNSNTAVTAAVKEALDEKDIPDRSSRNIIAVDAELKPKNVEVSNVESLPLPGVAE